MGALERFILSASMSSMMVAVVTLVATWLNIGSHPDLILHWATAYVIAWPIAALVGFIVLPTARRFAGWAISTFGRRV